MLKGNEALHTVLGSDILNHHTGLKVVDVHLFEQIRFVRSLQLFDPFDITC